MGSSIPLSVLLEYQGCRRRLSVSTVDGIPDAISDCLRRSYKVTAKLDLTSVGRTHVLQRWSNEWGCFVDVVQLEEVLCGDKLTVVPVPVSTSNSVSSITNVKSATG